MSASAAFNLVIAAVFARSTVKYLDRGYRFALMEAGGLGTQVGLVGECLGLHSFAMGGWVDDELNRMFGLEGVSEAVLLPVCCGPSPWS